MKNKLLSTLLTNAYRWLLRICLWIYHCLLRFLKLFAKNNKNQAKELTVLATGTFYSDNWLITHLRPMANAKNCKLITMVASTPVPDMDNVIGIYPPKMLIRCLGKVPARLLYFSWLAIKTRPDVLVGFHLLINGLFVGMLARLIGAKSVYICGGGEREVAGGGIYTENRIFNRIGREDKVIESLLIKAVNEMDLVISMGHGAVKYFKNRGVDAGFSIVPGGFDAKIFSPDQVSNKKYDLILVGRLSSVKRVDRFLKAVQVAKQRVPQLNAVIVGDGPERANLEGLATELGIAQDIHFAGWQDNVDHWLKLSRCFVLTSDSEGLSQALIQAMMTGIPAIVSNVGDLSDLVISESNGYLISNLNVESFSAAFIALLTNEDKLLAFSEHAVESTRKFSVESVALQWMSIFSEFKLNR